LNLLKVADGDLDTHILNKESSHDNPDETLLDIQKEFLWNQKK